MSGEAFDLPGPRAAHELGTLLVGGAYRVRIAGQSRVPTSGPVLLVSNHVSLLDGPLVQSFSPRPVTFLIKQEMFTGPIGAALRAFGQISVDRSRGDRAALGRAREVLMGGGVVGVFPEGTRGAGDVASIHTGAAWLASQTGATVVPVACVGTAGPGWMPGGLPLPFVRVGVTFGHPVPIEVPQGVPGREKLAKVSGIIQRALATHVRTSREWFTWERTGGGPMPGAQVGHTAGPEVPAGVDEAGRGDKDVP